MITIPLLIAALSAGLIGGFHCVGMCGGIANLLSSLPLLRAANATETPRKYMTAQVIPIFSQTIKQNNVELPASKLPQFYQLKLNAGRLTTYMLIGAMFGGLGAASLRWKSEWPIATVFFIFGNLALIFLGVRLLGIRVQSLLPASVNHQIQRVYGKLMPTMHSGSAHPYLLGMTWGCLPCGLSYAIAPFALLSGAAWSGAVLMLTFGLAALPHLLVAQSMSRRLKTHGLMRFTQILFALILIAFGLAGLFYFDMKNMPDFLCVTPQY